MATMASSLAPSNPSFSNMLLSSMEIAPTPRVQSSLFPHPSIPRDISSSITSCLNAKLALATDIQSSTRTAKQLPSKLHLQVDNLAASSSFKSLQQLAPSDHHVP